MIHQLQIQPLCSRCFFDGKDHASGHSVKIVLQIFDVRRSLKQRWLCTPSGHMRDRHDTQRPVHCHIMVISIIAQALAFAWVLRYLTNVHNRSPIISEMSPQGRELHHYDSETFSNLPDRRPGRKGGGNNLRLLTYSILTVTLFCRGWPQQLDQLPEWSSSRI